MKHPLIIPRLRGTDIQGSGAYGAKRGSRTHRGVDYASDVGTQVCSITSGKITKIGYPYSQVVKEKDDPPARYLRAARYVEVLTSSGYQLRYFYLDPKISLHQSVSTGQILGEIQYLPYPGITQHFHLEIIDPRGNYINPDDWLKDE